MEDNSNNFNNTGDTNNINDINNTGDTNNINDINNTNDITIGTNYIKHLFSKIGFCYVAYFGITIAAQLLISFILANKFIESLMQNIKNILLITFFISEITMYAIAFPIFLLMMKKIPRVSLPKNKLTAKNLLTILVMAFGIMMAGNLISIAIESLVGRINNTEVSNSLEGILKEIPLSFTILMTAVLAPIFEELLFRKILIDRCVQFGELNAIILSGIIFGLFHMNISQFFYATALGMIFAWVYIRTGNILYTMFLHFCINTVGGVIPSIFMRLGSTDSTDFSTMSPIDIVSSVYTILQVVIAVIGVILFIAKRKNMLVDPTTPVIDKKNMKLTYSNAGIITYIVMCIIIMIIDLLSRSGFISLGL
jgi:membrane protease YdiL (CAAX protease family)